MRAGRTNLSCPERFTRTRSSRELPYDVYSPPMGHTMLRYPRPARRLSGTATGQVFFSPLWRPNRLMLRVRRHGLVTLEQPTVCYSPSARLRSVKRIFRTGTYVQL